MSPPPLAPARRLLVLGAAFGSLVLASPGIVLRDGSALLAVLALAGWAWAASRPGRFAAWIEAALGAVAWSWICSWAALVYEGTLLWIGPGFGLYTVLAGVLLRRLAQRYPLALAAPVAWLFTETVRAVLPLPFGMQWMRLGTHLHAVDWLAGSARVWGFGGLGLVVAALGGLLAQLSRRERPGALALACGLGPLALAALLTRALPAPPTVPGPRLLLVQPGIPQERKMAGRDPQRLFVELVELTGAGLRDSARAGEPPPDLVCWGETMLPTFVVDPGLPAAFEAGVRFAPWVRAGWDLQTVRNALDWQREWVDGALFGLRGYAGVLPPGTAFLSGAEYLTVRQDRVRRQNAVFLWPAPGEPRGPVPKRFLVPSAETLYGLERFAWVRDVIEHLAGYLPDLHTDADAPRRLAFEARDGRTLHLSASVCFDNAFDLPFTRPLHEGPVDFHLVVSNEAWFRRGHEFDQMLAFSRLEALATARAVVRVTNSGVSALFAPDGRELARLVVEGRDRDVGGSLLVSVPVPTDEAAAGARTAFVRWRRGWTLAWLLAALALLLAALRSPPRGALAGPGNHPLEHG